MASPALGKIPFALVTPVERDRAMLTIDVALVRRLIATQFPRWAGLPVTPVEPGGWDNRTFRLGESMSVRLPSADRYVPAIEKEHRWLPRIAPFLPVPIPEPLALGAPGEGYPWSWSIYRWLAGEPASSARIADPAMFARSLAAFLRALQAVDTTNAPQASEHNFHRGGSLAVYDPQCRAALAAIGERIDIVTAKAIWERALASRWRQPPVWVHGDIAPGNLLVEADELCAVIDFGSSSIGDPSCDLVIAWTSFDGPARLAFRDTLALDDDTWARARGWALWKAAITLAGLDANQREADASWQVIEALLADHRSSVRQSP